MATLKEIRERIPLSEHELAKASGIALGTISRIENGKQKPIPRTIRKLAKALGVAPREIDFPK